MGSMLKSQDIIQNTIAYLHQQKLYGNELFLRKPLTEDKSVDHTQWKNLYELESAIQSCKKCRLSQNRTNTVMGAGDPESNVMIISDTPALIEHKDEKFKLLTKILAAIGFEREEVYVCSMLKCHLPSERNPVKDEIHSCIPFLLSQIELITPKMILLLGKSVGNVLLRNKKNVMELRSNNYYKMKDSYVYVTYHPAAIIKSNDPEKKKKKRIVWEDVQQLRHMYDKLVGDKPKWQQKRK